MKDLLSYLALVAASTATVATHYILTGTAIYVLWGWFVFPTFGYSLSFQNSIGIAILIEGIIPDRTVRKEGSKTEAVARLLSPLASILFGYIVTLF